MSRITSWLMTRKLKNLYLQKMSLYLCNQGLEIVQKGKSDFSVPTKRKMTFIIILFLMTLFCLHNQYLRYGNICIHSTRSINLRYPRNPSPYAIVVFSRTSQKKKKRVENTSLFTRASSGKIWNHIENRFQIRWLIAGRELIVNFFLMQNRCTERQSVQCPTCNRINSSGRRRFCSSAHLLHYARRSPSWPTGRFGFFFFFVLGKTGLTAADV